MTSIERTHCCAAFCSVQCVSNRDRYSAVHGMAWHGGGACVVLCSLPRWEYCTVWHYAEHNTAPLLHFYFLFVYFFNLASFWLSLSPGMPYNAKGSQGPLRHWVIQCSESVCLIATQTSKPWFGQFKEPRVKPACASLSLSDNHHVPWEDPEWAARKPHFKHPTTKICSPPQMSKHAICNLPFPLFVKG